MENDKKQLTLSEQLFQRLEIPLSTIYQATGLNNDAVRLFAEGQLSADQLTKFSVSLAREADNLAGKILKTDSNDNPMPENKQLAYSSLRAIGHENRKRAVDLVLTQLQKKQP
jgi:hypothetical protein